MRMVVFNKYGNATVPDEVWEAQRKYFDVLKKYLDDMSILEVRAFIEYVDIKADMAAYIIRRQLKIRKEEQAKL